MTAHGTARTMEKHHDLAVQRGPVVIIDDDVAVRDSLKFSLEIEGFSVCVWGSGQEFLNESGPPSYGCLIVDQNMPGLSGLDLIAILRGRKIFAPAILITSHPNRALRERAANAGIPIVEKPLLNETLVDGIRHALAQPRSR